MVKQRSSVLDTARGLGITLVVIGHNYIVARDMKGVHDWIYSFHMPLFMILSGIFFAPAPLSYKPFKQKVQSLLKPYITASVISAAIAAQQQTALDTALAVFGRIVLGSFVAAPDTIEWMPLWFLPHLFVVQTFAMVIHSITRNKIAITSIALMGATLGQNFFFDKGLPWGIDLTAVTCGYFLLGYLIYPKMLRYLSQPFVSSALGAAFGVTWAIALLVLEPTVDLHLRLYTGLNAFVVAVLGCAFAIFVCAAIQQWHSLVKWVSELGRYSLYILLFHGWIQGKITGTLASRFDSTWVPLGIGVTGAVFLCFVAGKFIERSEVLRSLFLPGGRKQQSR